MKILDRYLGRAVLQGALLVLLVLVALMTVIDFVVELADVGTGNYGLLQAIEYIALTMPRRTFEMLPLAALIGSLFGLGTLANNSELVVVRAAGISLLRIAASVLRVGLVLIVIALILGELVAPVTDQWAQERRAAALSEEFSNKTKLGFWVRDGDRYVNIRHILPGSRLADVWVYEFDNAGHLRSALHAAGADYTNGEWHLRDVARSEIGSDRVNAEHMAQMVWHTDIDPELVKVVSVEPERLSTLGLYQYIEYLRQNGLESQRYRIAFWIRVLSPLATVLMLLLALPFVFGSIRSVPVSQRVLVGTLIGIGFQLVSRSLGYLGQVFALNPLFAAALPLLLFAGLAAWLMRRAR